MWPIFVQFYGCFLVTKVKNPMIVTGCCLISPFLDLVLYIHSSSSRKLIFLLIDKLFGMVKIDKL